MRSRAPARRLPATGQAPPLGLRRNFAWTLAGNGLYAASQWGILIALAKMADPAAVGRFALGLAVTAPIFLFTNLQLRAVQATDARAEFRFGEYLRLRMLMTAGAILTVALVVGIAGEPRSTSLAILAVAGAKAVESLSDVAYGLFQRRERMDWIAVSMTARGPLSLALLGIAVHVTGSVAWGAVAMAAAFAIVLATYDVSRVRRALAAEDGGMPAAVRPERSFPRILRLARIALPLGFVMTLVSLNANIPRYFLEAHLGERDLGIFTALAQVTVAGTMIVNALGQSATPRLAGHYSEKNAAEFRRLLGRLLIGAAGLGAGGLILAAVAGRPILAILYRPEYAAQVNVLHVLVLGAALSFLSSFLGYGMTAARSFRAQVPLFTIVVLGTTAASALLVPRFGLMGAAWATVATSSLSLIGGAIVLAAALRRLPPAPGAPEVRA